MKKQIVVRVYPFDFITTLEPLEDKLKDGWKVLMVTKLLGRNNIETADYILEKEEENDY